MRHKPLLKVMMTPFPYSIGQDAPVAEALELMEAHAVHHLPVTEGHALVAGVIRDTLRERGYLPAE